MKTKRIKLRGWVLVVLRTLLIIDMFFMVCIAEDLDVMILKTLITVTIALLICLIFIKFEV